MKSLALSLLRAAVDSFFSGLFLALGLTFTLVSQADPAPKQNGIVFGKIKTFPPYFISDDEGRQTGFFIDMIDAVTRRLGVQASYIDLESSKGYAAGLEQGRFDAVAWGVTPDREEYLSFTAPIQTFNISLFVRDDEHRIRGLGDMQVGRVGVVRANAAQKILSKRDGIELQIYSDISSALFGLLSGDVDSIAYPEPIVRKLARDVQVDNRIKVVGKPIRSIKLALAVSRGNRALFALLDQAVKELVASDQYPFIYAKWFGQPEPYWTVARIGWSMGALLILVLAGMGGWRYHSVIGLNERMRGLIAELMQSEKAQRESEERFKDFAEASSDWFWEMDATLRFNYLSDRFPEITGMRIADVIGTQRWQHRSSLCADEDWDQHRVDLSARRPFKGFEYCIDGDGDEPVYVSVSGVPRFDVDGQFVGYRGSARDITELKRSEEALRRSQRMEAVGQLTGGVAHDFNNLLGVMLGNAELLMDKLEADESTRKKLDAICDAVNRGASLTQRLLSFSRKQTLSSCSTPVNVLVLGLEEMLRRTLGETIELRTHLPSGVWNALVDPHQLENAIINLSINARDAMPRGGTLSIETANVSLDENYAKSHEDVVPGDYVMIAVTDTGTGIAPGVLARVFEPFFTTKNVGEGSGLGLSMVYGFSKQSNGHAAIYSEEGHGTTFKLYLPRTEASLASKGAVDEAVEHKPGSGRILVVEDDDNLREVPVSVLRDQGYQVVEARDAREAIDQLNTAAPFELLFTDVVLPGGMSGVDVAQMAKGLQPKIKILYTTGYAENAITHHGQLDPGVAVISKPYRRHELLERVSAVLEGRVG